MKSSPLPKRHIHLDFHTSPFIPEVAADFDADEFASIMADARVDNVNIFGKCHHGMSYYPTKIGEMHPHLNGRDLLGEMIEALHRRNISCPVYTTIVWEERVADLHPEWRQQYSNGRFAQIQTSADAVTVQPGGWRFNSFAHPEYQEYFETHLAELMDNYDLDGLWMDILFCDIGADFNPEARKLRAKWGVEKDTPEDNAKFEGLAQQAFGERITRFIKGRKPDLPIFYNSSNRAFLDSRYGWARRMDHMSHMEIESLPSGFWGYFHYPRLARQAMTWDKPFVGMTGRFQKMWGDFGGCKPQAALEFECFRTQATGGACSVGDQMHPRGTLDRGAYDMIGKVYEQVEAAEPFYEDTTPVFDGAVLLAGRPGEDETLAGQSEEGAVLMMEELNVSVAVLDDRSSFEDYAFLILPDTTTVDEDLAAKLKQYHANGGTLITSFQSGQSPEGKWMLDFLPCKTEGLTELFPTYWTGDNQFCPSVGEDGRVIYQQGAHLKGGENGNTRIHRRLPYFNRTDLTFCSHFQTPPDPASEATPALIIGKGVAMFADPVFREYRQVGNTFLRDAVEATLKELNLQPVSGSGTDYHVVTYPRRKKNDLHLTLLNYLPSRKSMAIDVIERGLPYQGQTLNLKAEQIETWPEGQALKLKEGRWMLPPDSQGRLLLKAKGFFQ